MPTKKTPSKKTSSAPREQKSDLRSLRAEFFSLKMKHALRELKEVHKLRNARRDIARHLTKLHKS